MSSSKAIEGIRFNRPIKNGAEQAFVAWCEANGHKAMKRGWPDYFVVVPGAGQAVMLVEIKPKKGRRLKREQVLVLRRLAAYGVPCYRWDPDSGFERIYGPRPRA